MGKRQSPRNVLSVQRIGVWFRRLSWIDRVDVFTCAYFWFLTILAIVDAVIWNSWITTDRWMPAATVAGLAVLTTWCVASFTRSPDDAVQGHRKKLDKKRLCQFLVVMIGPAALGIVAGWVVFDVTAGVPAEDRVAWVIWTGFGVFAASYAILIVVMFLLAWKTFREAERIAARIRANRLYDD